MAAAAWGRVVSLVRIAAFRPHGTQAAAAALGAFIRLLVNAALRQQEILNAALRQQEMLKPRCDSANDWCPGEDLNLHGMLLPLGPEPSASANSATWADSGGRGSYRAQKAMQAATDGFARSSGVCPIR